MQKETSTKEKPTLVAKSALLFGSGTLTSRILGLIRDALIAQILPKDVRDAWIAAFRLPNFFRRLLGEGGLSVSFIPIFVETREKGDSEAQKRLVSGVFSLLMSVVSFIWLLCFLFMEVIVQYWLGGEGFTSVPGKIEMTISMGRVMVGFLFFITLFAYFMALLNGVKKFGMTGFAPVLLNISIICGLYYFQDSESIYQVSAWSVVIGGALQAIFLFPALVKNKIVPLLSFKYCFDPSVRRVLKKFMPTVFGVGVLQILTMVNTYFASQLESGAVSNMYYADRLLELPLSLIAVSIGTALLPTLSEHWGKGDKSLFLSCVQKHFQLFYFLAIPAAVGLWVIGDDIIQVLFVRGEFSVKDSETVGSLLQVYSLTLLCVGSLKIFNQSFYASKDTLTPAIISVCGLVVHMLMAPYWIESLGLQGLVLSTALITLFNVVVSVTILNLRVGSLRWLAILPHLVKCITSAGLMGVYLYYIHGLEWKQGRFIIDFPILLIFVFIAVVIYFGVSSIFKVEETSKVLSRFKRS